MPVMTEAEIAMLDGARRARACEVILRDSTYQSPAFRLAHQTVKSELGRLEIEVAKILPAESSENG